MKSKRKLIAVCTAAIASVTLLSGALYAYSKNTGIFGMINGSHVDTHLDRIAEYEVVVDGVPSDTVDFKAYATTKLSDIKQVGTKIQNGSFKEDAYQLHTISVTNNSEVDVSCDIVTTKTTNDDRVFFAVIDNVSTENQLFAKLKGTDLDDISSVRNHVNDISLDGTKVVLKQGQTKTLTMIVWAEHDAVYPDTDGDGVADEEGKKLAELADGVPRESYHLDYVFAQVD